MSQVVTEPSCMLQMVGKITKTPYPKKEAHQTDWITKAVTQAIRN